MPGFDNGLRLGLHSFWFLGFCLDCVNGLGLGSTWVLIMGCIISLGWNLLLGFGQQSGSVLGLALAFGSWLWGNKVVLKVLLWAPTTLGVSIVFRAPGCVFWMNNTSSTIHWDILRSNY